MALVCLPFLTGAAVVQKAAGQEAVKPPDPYKDSKILVEAFVVEVELDALYKQGVSPIGQKPKAVSIMNILRCFKDKDAAKVTAGTKLALNHNEQSRIEEVKTIFEEPLKITTQ